jgi:hypothetical protein
VRIGGGGDHTERDQGSERQTGHGSGVELIRCPRLSRAPCRRPVPASSPVVAYRV